MNKLSFLPPAEVLRVAKRNENNGIYIPEDRLVKIPSTLIYPKEANRFFCLIETRVGGEFKGSAFYLSPSYDWVMGKDNLGDMILVPIKV